MKSSLLVLLQGLAMDEAAALLGIKGAGAYLISMGMGKLPRSSPWASQPLGQIH